MENEKKLDNIIDDEEAKMDENAASIFRFSAEMKKDIKLVDDQNGFELYYLSISPNNSKYLERIEKMDLNEIDMLYAALKHPVIFVDIANKEVKYLNQGFEGLEVRYSIMKTKISDKEVKRLSKLYLKAKNVETNDDLKYAEMYDISSKIKNKGVRVILTKDEQTLEFYLTDISELGENGKRIIDYLKNLKNEDANYFISVSNLFSIIDTKNKVLYAMESYQDKDGKEIVKMLTHDKKEGGFDFMYDIAERAKKNPNEKVFFIDQKKEETYSPNSKAPSDMYA